jgi:glycosyltransferase involved in cell wall biosynthesis
MALIGGSMKKKILLKAPLLTRSGYGEQGRFALRSLRSREDLFDIYIQPLTWGHTSWINDATEERRWIDQIIEKTIYYIQEGGHFDVSLQVSIPNEWENIATCNIGYTAGMETTKVAWEWIEKGNPMDSIVVVSNHSKQIYEQTVYEGTPPNSEEVHKYSLTTPITAVNYPVKKYDNLEPLGLELDFDYNFLCIAQFGPRKNIMNTVKWFVEEFHDEEVGLVIKGNFAKNCTMDRDHVFNTLVHPLNSEHPDRKCKIYLLHGDLTDEEMHSLYIDPKIKGLLSLTHGEGFGLPLFEAAYSGMPVIATGWSGQLDFLCDEDRKENFYNVAFDLGPVPEQVLWESVIIKESMWAYPRENSAKEMMRLCYNDHSEGSGFASSACEYAEKLHERFEENKMYAQFIDALNLDTSEFDVENWISSLEIEEIE